MGRADVLMIGSELRLAASGRRAVVSRLIGEGSQGQVFEAAIDNGSSRVAIKWYFPHTGTPHQRDVVLDLIDRGPPSDRFLWPAELIDLPNTRGFGYVMPLRSERYASLVELLMGKVDMPFSLVCRLCLELSHSFLQLHAQGLCYRDISFGNVFFDPKTGFPMICDNDNVGVDGAGPTTVLGTRRFMAPEVVRREAVPSSVTDLYSLSVLLFYILMMGHPLVGRREDEFDCWDDHAESSLFGEDPLFIFDPSDRSNEPIPGVHGTVLRYWGLYPSFLRSLFITAFTRGLIDPLDGRVRESVWRTNMARLLGTIIRCEACEKENFYDPGVEQTTCWCCDRPLGAPLWLTVEHRGLALGRGSVVHRHLLTGDYDFDHRVGEVVPNPREPTLLGLQNQTDAAWRATLANREERVVEPGRSIRLTTGTRLRIAGSLARLNNDPPSF